VIISRQGAVALVLRPWWLAKIPPGVRQRIWSLFHRQSGFVHRHLDGLRGIEIGASAHNDFGVDAINVDRYDSMDTKYKQEEWSRCGRKRPVDVVAPGDDLPFQDDSVDFVLASHVLEHIPDPIRALEEWIRVARHKVVVVVPHRDRTFDHDRELTSLEEFLRRHESGFSSAEDQHWSVWTLESFVAMCDYFGFKVLDRLDPDDKVGNGFLVAIDASR
jgi:SAM-dependent methyltransferase